MCSDIWMLIGLCADEGKINDAGKLVHIYNVGNRVYISNTGFPHLLCFMVYLLALAVALNKVLLR